MSLLKVPLGKRQKENTGNVLKFIQVQLTCSNFDCLNLIAASTKYGSNSSILISFKWDSSWSWMPLSFLVTNARQMPNMETKSQRNFEKYLPRPWSTALEVLLAVDTAVINEIDKMGKTLNEDNIVWFWGSSDPPNLFKDLWDYDPLNLKRNIYIYIYMGGWYIFLG